MWFGLFHTGGRARPNVFNDKGLEAPAAVDFARQKRYINGYFERRLF